jgi:hypothetical protein
LSALGFLGRFLIACPGFDLLSFVFYSGPVWCTRVMQTYRALVSCCQDVLCFAEPYAATQSGLFWEMVCLVRRIGIILLDVFLYEHKVRRSVRLFVIDVCRCCEGSLSRLSPRFVAVLCRLFAAVVASFLTWCALMRGQEWRGASFALLLIVFLQVQHYVVSASGLRTAAFRQAVPRGVQPNCLFNARSS